MRLLFMFMLSRPPCVKLYDIADTTRLRAVAETDRVGAFLRWSWPSGHTFGWSLRNSDVWNFPQRVVVVG